MSSSPEAPEPSPKVTSTAGRDNTANRSETGEIKVDVIGKLFEHHYFLHLLDQKTSELFWKRVLAWRASVVTILGIILTLLGWLGFHWNEFLNRKTTEFTKIQEEGKREVENVKTELRNLQTQEGLLTPILKSLTEQAGTVGKQAEKVATDLDTLQSQKKDLERTLEQANRDLKALGELNTNSRVEIDKRMQELEVLKTTINSFRDDVAALGDIQKLSAEARRVRLFRMVLMHSGDSREIGLDVPNGLKETKPITIAFRTSKIHSGDYVELTWDVREGEHVPRPPHTMTLFPGEQTAVGDSDNLLLLRLEALRKQSFARPFLVLTIRAKAADEPSPSYERDSTPKKPSPTVQRLKD